MDTTTTQRKPTGLASKYRGKLRDKPLSITLTQDGHDALARGVERTGLSKADYIEDCIRARDRRASGRPAA